MALARKLLSVPRSRNRVAVVVPAYRSERTIRATLDSIQAQGDFLHQVDVVIVADDHGSDRTAEVARESWFRREIPLRVVERTKNQGQYRNLNEVVRELEPGIEWILVLHADDTANRNWLATMLSRIDAADERTASIGSSWDYVDSQGDVRSGARGTQAESQIYRGELRTMRDTLLAGCWWHLSACAIRVRAYQDVGMLRPEMSCRGDWDLLLRFYERRWNVEYVPMALMQYRENPQGNSAKSFASFIDIEESLSVIRFHIRNLYRWDVVRLHGRYFWRALGRTGKFILWFRFRAAAQGIRTLASIMANFVRCLSILAEGPPFPFP